MEIVFLTRLYSSFQNFYRMKKINYKITDTLFQNCMLKDNPATPYSLAKAKELGSSRSLWGFEHNHLTTTPYLATANHLQIAGH